MNILIALARIIFIMTRIEMSNSFFQISTLDICDGNKINTYMKKLCPGNKLVFTGNSTKLNSDCVCISGVWLIINRDCSPSVMTSMNGCIPSPKIKAMQHLGDLGIVNDFFVVISTQSKVEFKYKLLRPVQTDRVSGYIWIYNGILYEHDFYRESYCAAGRGNRKGKKMARYAIRGKLSVQFECLDNYRTEIKPQLQYNVVNEKTSECKLNCMLEPKSKLIRKPKSENWPFKKMFLKKPKSLRSKNKTLSKLGKMESRLKLSGKISPTIKDKELLRKKKKAKMLKNMLKSFKGKLLETILSLGFGDKEIANSDTEEFKYPKYSFEILEKLQEIVGKACPVISKRFLELSFIMFRSVFEIRGTHLMERLKEKDARKIMRFLSECYASIQSITLEGDCVNQTMARSSLDRRRHVTLEIPWKMIDLTVGVCIDAFGPSYIHYHKMEQKLERLFTRKLRTLWKRPPKYEELYRRLYGPNWRFHFEKLEDCVNAVYSRNPKLSRLRRPDEIRTNVEDHECSHPEGYHETTPSPKLIKIQELLPPKFYQDIPKGKIIIPSVNLTCEPFDNTEFCLF